MNFDTVLQHPGALTIITDTLDSPANFILLNILSSHLRNSSSSTSVFVSFSETFAHWISTASRLSPAINLRSYQDSGKLSFFDGLNSELQLLSLHNKIRSALAQSRTSTGTGLVILDGISMLEWTGTSHQDISRFIRAIRALCHAQNAVLLIRHHVTDNYSKDAWDMTAFQLSSYHIEVLPLSSGRSGAVSGQIAIHRGPLATTLSDALPIKRSNAVQYRLADMNVVFFERGTNTIVL